ncbi:MAG TPA: RNA polymerase sigma factor [Gemmatimonas sp.]|uniref:RNA polymerase sigma factor n=1 Tax=Gemmatimonas sp. TaxID=1962908 RepID=UPI002EDA8FA9
MNDLRQDDPRDAQFERDVLACLPDVARFARSLVHDEAGADDLVQETFLRAYRGYASFQPGAAVRRWLFAICHNVWLRTMERERRMVHTAEGNDAELEALAMAREHAMARQDGIDGFIGNIDVRPAILTAIRALPPAFRSVVELVDVQDLGYHEAASVLGVPVGTVRSRLYRARRLLQIELLSFARDAGVVDRSTPSPINDPEAP